MKLCKRLFIFSAFFILLSCFHQETKHQESDRAKKELLKAIDAFNTAFQTGDVETIASLVTNNYIHTNGNSKAIRKNDWFAYLNKRSQEIELGILEVLTYQMDEVEIELYDNTAIVTGKVSVSNNKEGKIINNEYRITNIWVQEAGQWKRAGFHDGKIK